MADETVDVLDWITAGLSTLSLRYWWRQDRQPSTNS